jgi:hypothetical protein
LVNATTHRDARMASTSTSSSAAVLRLLSDLRHITTGAIEVRTARARA